MKGTSKLILNQETVAQAVQDYLDKHFTPNVKMSGLTPKSESAGYGAGWSYEVTIDEIVEQKTGDK